MTYIIDLIREYGIIVPFLALLIESSSPIGAPIPGAIIAIATGMLCSTGVISWDLGFSAVFLGTLAGDYIGYGLGYWYDKKFHHKESEGKATDLVCKFQRYALPFIFFSRFMFVIRSFIPNIAGLCRVRRRVFFTVNLIGAIIWTLFYFPLGLFLGKRALEYSFHMNLGFILFLILFIYIYIKVKNGYKKDDCPIKS